MTESITDHHKEHKYPLHLIKNMDEMLLTFHMPPNQTGEKTVKICTTGNEKIEQNSCVGLLWRQFQTKAHGHLLAIDCTTDQ